jgi:hypothetical protein
VDLEGSNLLESDEPLAFAKEVFNSCQTVDHRRGTNGSCAFTKVIANKQGAVDVESAHRRSKPFHAAHGIWEPHPAGKGVRLLEVAVKVLGESPNFSRNKSCHAATPPFSLKFTPEAHTRHDKRGWTSWFFGESVLASKDQTFEV